MKRREFITLIGSAVAAWPRAARAQQGERVRRIGVLTLYSQTDREGQARIAAFLDTVRRLGWTDGRNVADRVSLERWRHRPLRRVGSGKRITLTHAGEQYLDEWMGRNAFVAWVPCPEPWSLSAYCSVSFLVH
jgi:putative ABC transport system substrate-binding protein